MMTESHNSRRAWNTRSYSVPTLYRSGFRWKASAVRRLQHWKNRHAPSRPVTVVVPALFSLLPGETVAMGWLNEIDALGAIRQRMSCAAKITGWDVFTFHTLYNLDHYFDSTIAAEQETWIKEGTLSTAAIRETKQKFGKPYDYHRVQPRLIENLVFQSSLLDWVGNHGSDVPLRFHVIGTGLLSALVSFGAMPFGAAVNSMLRFGARWDEMLSNMAATQNENEIGWSRFEQIRKLVDGRSTLALAVSHEDLPLVDAPCKPFWYSPTGKEEPVLITTANEAAAAMKTLNLASWSNALPDKHDEQIRGWLVSPMHPMARLCRWSVSNYLLATPSAATLFLENIATLGCQPVMIQPEMDAFQNRLRLSRMKVTGP